MRIELPGQYVLARSSFVMNHEFVEARILVQMPSVVRPLCQLHRLLVMKHNTFLVTLNREVMI